MNGWLAVMFFWLGSMFATSVYHLSGRLRYRAPFVLADVTIAAALAYMGVAR